MSNVEWEDFYEILGISPESTEKEISDTYLFKVNILHPDRLGGCQENIKHRAEEELKRVNRAYDILKDPQQRRNFHAEWCHRKGRLSSYPGYSVEPPRPIVEPPYIDFGVVEPGETKKAYFIIRNEGGTYTNVLMTEPSTWLHIVRKTSPSPTEKLPLRVELEAQAQDWSKDYSETIKIRLDNTETQVRVVLRTRAKGSEGQTRKYVISEKTCPNKGCGRALYHDVELNLWGCRHCHRVYTENELDKKQPRTSSQGQAQRSTSRVKTILFSLIGIIGIGFVIFGINFLITIPMAVTPLVQPTTPSPPRPSPVVTQPTAPSPLRPNIVVTRPTDADFAWDDNSKWTISNANILVTGTATNKHNSYGVIDANINVTMFDSAKRVLGTETVVVASSILPGKSEQYYRLLTPPRNCASFDLEITWYWKSPP